MTAAELIREAFADPLELGSNWSSVNISVFDICHNTARVVIWQTGKIASVGFDFTFGKSDPLTTVIELRRMFQVSGRALTNLLRGKTNASNFAGHGELAIADIPYQSQ